MEEKIRFVLNGKPVELPLVREHTLLWTLRTHFNLTGTKYGCGLGYCGACIVLVNNKPIRSCSIYMEDVGGKKIITIEGLSTDGKLHPIQQAFAEHDAL